MVVHDLRGMHFSPQFIITRNSNDHATISLRPVANVGGQKILF